MTVPLSEAVASRVPVELVARCAMGVLCAWMMLDTWRERRSKMRTSPGDWELPEAEKGDVGDGTGEGYAR